MQTEQLQNRTKVLSLHNIYKRQVNANGTLFAVCAAPAGKEGDLEAETNANDIVSAYNNTIVAGIDPKYVPDLFAMVRELKQCINRLSQDGLTQDERDKEAQWEGEAHELLLKINPNYFRNANESTSKVNPFEGIMHPELKSDLTIFALTDNDKFEPQGQTELSPEMWGIILIDADGYFSGNSYNYDNKTEYLNDIQILHDQNLVS